MEELGKVTVRLFSAQLGSRHHKKKRKEYEGLHCKLYMDCDKKGTLCVSSPVEEATDAPQWNEECEIKLTEGSFADISGESSSLIVSISDRNGEFKGYASLNVLDLPAAPGGEMHIELTKHKRAKEHNRQVGTLMYEAWVSEMGKSVQESRRVEGGADNAIVEEKTPPPIISKIEAVTNVKSALSTCRILGENLGTRATDLLMVKFGEDKLLRDCCEWKSPEEIVVCLKRSMIEAGSGIVHIETKSGGEGQSEHECVWFPMFAKVEEQFCEVDVTSGEPKVDHTDEIASVKSDDSEVNAVNDHERNVFSDDAEVKGDAEQCEQKEEEEDQIVRLIDSKNPPKIVDISPTVLDGESRGLIIVRVANLSLEETGPVVWVSLFQQDVTDHCEFVHNGKMIKIRTDCISMTFEELLQSLSSNNDPPQMGRRKADEDFQCTPNKIMGRVELRTTMGCYCRSELCMEFNSFAADTPAEKKKRKKKSKLDSSSKNQASIAAINVVNAIVKKGSQIQRTDVLCLPKSDIADIVVLLQGKYAEQAQSARDLREYLGKIVNRAIETDNEHILEAVDD
eukprot:Nk52_evm4s2473 gene=Nk52_evmTU4s2473